MKYNYNTNKKAVQTTIWNTYYWVKFKSWQRGAWRAVEEQLLTKVTRLDFLGISVCLSVFKSLLKTETFPKTVPAGDRPPKTGTVSGKWGHLVTQPLTVTQSNFGGDYVLVKWFSPTPRSSMAMLVLPCGAQSTVRQSKKCEDTSTVSPDVSVLISTMWMGSHMESIVEHSAILFPFPGKTFINYMYTTIKWIGLLYSSKLPGPSLWEYFFCFTFTFFFKFVL